MITTRKVERYYASDGTEFSDKTEAETYEKELEEKEEEYQTKYPILAAILLQDEEDWSETSGMAEEEFHTTLKQPEFYPCVVLIHPIERAGIFQCFYRYVPVTQFFEAFASLWNANAPQAPATELPFPAKMVWDAFCRVKRWNNDYEDRKDPQLGEDDMKVIEAALKLFVNKGKS